MIIKSQGRDLKFDSVEKFERWLREQVNFWEWVFEIEESKLKVFNIEPLEKLFEYFQWFLDHKSLIEIDRETDFKTIIDLYETNKVLRTDSRKAKFVKGHAQNDPVFALTILNYFTNSLQDVDDRKIKAIVSAYLFNKGISESTVRQEIEQLRGLKDTYSEKIEMIDREYIDSDKRFSFLKDRLEEKYIEHQEKLSSQIVEFKSATEKIKKNYEDELLTVLSDNKKLINEAVVSFEKSIDKTENSLSLVKERFTEELMLKQPVEFWIEKKNYHKESARKFTKALFAILPITTVIIFILGFFLLLDAPQNPIGSSVLFLSILSSSNKCNTKYTLRG